MADVLLFHHIQGLVDAVHAVDTIEEGFGFARNAGFDTIWARGLAAADAAALLMERVQAFLAAVDRSGS